MLDIVDVRSKPSARIAQGDLSAHHRKLRPSDRTIDRGLIYETSTLAPPEALHAYLMAYKEDGFHARRRLRELLDRYGLAEPISWLNSIAHLKPNFA